MTERFCLLTPEFPGRASGGRGGVGTYAALTASALVALGWEVTVVRYHVRGAAYPAGAAYAVDVPVVQVELAAPGPVARSFPGLVEGVVLRRAIRALDRERRFDLIEGPNDEGICWSVARWAGPRFVMRLHSSLQQHVVMKGQAMSWARRFAIHLDGVAVRRSQTLVTHTAAHADAMRAEYRLGQRAIRLLPHATPAAPRTSFRERVAWVGFIGTLDRRKGVDLFLEAASRLAAAWPEVRFVCIGRDPTGEFSRAPSGGPPPDTGRVLFTGSISDDALATWWERLDLLVVPSRYESFGLTVVEAFSRGIAVVCTDAEALVEVAGDGAVVAAQDAPALAEAVSTLLGDAAARRAVAEAGHRRYLAEYAEPILRDRLARQLSRET